MENVQLEEQVLEQEDTETWQRLIEAGLVDSAFDLTVCVLTDKDIVTRETIFEEILWRELET